MSNDPTHEAGPLWVESVHQLSVLIRGINEQGGISAVGAQWHVPTKILVSAELERIAVTLGEWARQLSQEAARLAPPGSGEAPPPGA